MHTVAIIGSGPLERWLALEAACTGFAVLLEDRLVPISVQLALARQDVKEQDLFLGSRPVFSHSDTSQQNGASDQIDHGMSSSAISKLRHTSRTPEPADTAPVCRSQTGSADGQSAYRSRSEFWRQTLIAEVTIPNERVRILPGGANARETFFPGR